LIVFSHTTSSEDGEHYEDHHNDMRSCPGHR
jgi:hypothetical protein